MSNSEMIEYICQVLNIKTENTFVIQDMIQDLTEIQNLADFRLFIKECKNYEKYRYETGYQKFISMVNDFKKAHKPTLDTKTLEKVYLYSEKVFSKVTTVYDELNWILQMENKNINDVKSLDSNFDEKENQILHLIGTPKDIMNLVLNNKTKLKEEIESKIEMLAYKKQYPQLENKNNTNQKVLQLIKGK